MGNSYSITLERMEKVDSSRVLSLRLSDSGNIELEYCVMGNLSLIKVVARYDPQRLDERGVVHLSYIGPLVPITHLSLEGLEIKEGRDDPLERILSMATGQLAEIQNEVTERLAKMEGVPDIGYLRLVEFLQRAAKTNSGGIVRPSGTISLGPIPSKRVSIISDDDLA